MGIIVGRKRMEYITVKETAKKWNISERLVQKYCAAGRIEGVDKFGGIWKIPSNAVKPMDPRKDHGQKDSDKGRGQTAIFADLMPLMSTIFEPGTCQEYIDTMEDGPKKEIALAEYYYFSGQPEKAVEKAELYLTSPEIALKLSACLICAYSNLSIGQIHIAKHCLAEMKHTLMETSADMPPQLRAAETFIAFAAAVLLHLPLPDKIPPLEEILSFLPPGLQMFSLYVQAHYMYLNEEYGKSLGIAETALALQAKEYPIPSIYLHLISVMDYMSLRRPGKAQEHLLSAWELARPDDLIQAFGEHHGLLGGMLEAVIKPKWPEDFKRMIKITYRFSEGWRKVHNPITGHEVADNLTTTEFATAMLASRGWTNQEISEHLNISPNTVKRYISMALQKLNIKHRKDLKKYMLQ